MQTMLGTLPGAPAEAPNGQQPPAAPQATTPTPEPGTDPLADLNATRELLDVDSFDTEEARDLARQVNAERTYNNRLREHFDSRLAAVEGHMSQFEQAEMQAIAKQCVQASLEATAQILDTFKVNVKPEYLMTLMREERALVEQHGRFDADIFVKIFQRAHASELIEASRRPASTLSAPQTISAGGNTARLNTDQTLSNRELIERDLVAAGLEFSQ